MEKINDDIKLSDKGKNDSNKQCIQKDKRGNNN